MKIDVPFYESVEDTDCGPCSLKMTLAYFKEEHSIDKLSKLMKRLDSGMTWTIGVSLAAKKLGFQSKFFTINPGEQVYDLDFYKKYSDDKAMLTLREIIDEMEKLNVDIEKKNLTLDELLGFVSEYSVPIVLLNWHKIRNKDGFYGHIVPVTGYDEENIYVHNPGRHNLMSYFPIKRELFKESWESEGTDKDVAVIYKK